MRFPTLVWTGLDPAYQYVGGDDWQLNVFASGRDDKGSLLYSWELRIQRPSKLAFIDNSRPPYKTMDEAKAGAQYWLAKALEMLEEYEG